MMTSLPGTPRRANTPAHAGSPSSSEAARRPSTSSHRRHSISGGAGNEQLSQEFTNLYRCGPSLATVTLVVRVEAGDSQPSSDEADSGDGVDSGSGSSLESIIVHDLEEDHPTPSDMGDRMESLSIAEAQKPTLAPAPLSLGIGSTSPPSQPALIPFEPYNPRVAGYAAYPYGIDNGYSFGADLPLGMNPDAYNYPSGYHTQTHTRYPSFSSDYPQTHLLPRSPSFYHSNSLYPTADPGANAPLSWNHDCPPHSSHGSYTSNALHFIPYQQRQAIFYPSTAPGMTTPPSPPDHLQLPRRPSDASDASSYGRSQNIYVGHAPWEQYQAPMAPAVSAAVVQQLQTGGVMRRQGVTKFFDQQKGFGFIVDGNRAEMGKDIFVHYTALLMKHGFRCLHAEEPVEYDLVMSSNGGFQALNVSGIRGQRLKGLSPLERRDKSIPRDASPRFKYGHRRPPADFASTLPSSAPFPPRPSYRSTIGSGASAERVVAAVSLPTPESSREGSGTTTPLFVS